VHRIGRTARAGQEGHAISLVCVDELKLLRDIEKLLGSDIEKVNLPGYDIDPTIKAEPIQNGRGGRSNSGGRGGRNGNGRGGKPGGGNRSGAHSGGGNRRSN
jgi:ATP-dependent RNA helicase RhlE